MDGRLAVEADPFHRRVPDDPGAVPADRPGDRMEMLAAQDRAGGHDRTHEQHRGGARPDSRRELARVSGPSARAGGTGHEPGHTAREADPVDQPGIDGVTDHRLPSTGRSEAFKINNL